MPKRKLLKLLWEMFKYLQPDGKVHFVEDVIQTGMHNNLHPLLFPAELLLPEHQLCGKCDDAFPTFTQAILTIQFYTSRQ